MIQRRQAFQGLAGLFAAGLAEAALPRGAAAAPVTRGGTLTFARASDCIYLDPVHTSQNADIWISLNIHDTLIQPTPDGKALQPGLAETYEVVGGRADGHAEDPSRSEVRRRLAAGAVRHQVVARSRTHQGERRHVPVPVGSHRRGGDHAALDRGAEDVASRPGDPAGARHLQCRDHAGEAVEAAPGDDLEAKAKSFAEHPIGTGPFMLTSWTRQRDGAEPQPELLEAGRGRQAAALSRQDPVRDHPRRCDAHPEAEGGRDRRRRVHSLLARRRAEGRPARSTWSCTRRPG